LLPRGLGAAGKEDGSEEKSLTRTKSRTGGEPHRGAFSVSPGTSTASSSYVSPLVVPKSKVNPPLNQQESVRTRRVVRNFTEISRSRVKGRHIGLGSVNGIQSIHPQLEIDPLMNLKLTLDIGVQPVQSVRPSRPQRD
jgi:hypothetical protein